MKKLFSFAMKVCRKLLKMAYVIFCGVCWIIFRAFPICKRKVVISSYYGRGYGDNPKYIAQELLKKNKDIKIMDQSWVASAPRYPAGKRLVATFPNVQIGSVVSYKITTSQHFKSSSNFVPNLISS